MVVDQRVRNSTDVPSELGSAMISGTTADFGERKSDGRHIRWEKVRGGNQGGELPGGSYGTFVGSSIDFEETSIRRFIHWKWIVLIVFLVVMGFANWFGLGISGEFGRILFAYRRAWNGLCEGRTDADFLL